MHSFSLKFATAICLFFSVSAGDQDADQERWKRRDLALQKRIVCNADNVLRALQHNGPNAVDYCQSFIGLDYRPTSIVAVPATPTAVIVTTTYTVIETMYPDGKLLESFPFAPYVSAYPGSRVSSGCTCLLGPTTTTFTSTYTGATITSSTVTTSTSTLTGLCATDIPYSGVFSLISYGSETAPAYPTTNSAFGITPYQCCIDCQVLLEGFCVGYYAVPGVSCVILQVYIEPGDVCSLNGLFSTSSVYPNNLGGPGPCAATIVVN